MTHHPSQETQASQLPPYRGLMAVDCVQFSKNRSVHLAELSAQIPSALETTLTRCGIPQVWEKRRFPQGTGDGYIFGTQTKYIPVLIEQVLPTLQDVLYEMAPALRYQERTLNLRLRASIHVGPVRDSGDQLRDRISEPTVYVCRLLDSKPLRDALRNSDPDVTLIGAMISNRVFEDVVRAGYTKLHEAEFEHVTADVAEKNFSQSAWLYVPRRSYKGENSAPAKNTAVTRHPASPASATAIFHGNVGQNITATEIHDGVHLNLPDGFFDSPQRKKEGES